MAISPFEERYRTKMNDIFEDDTKIRKWMAVEVALSKAHAALGNIPKDAPAKIEGGASKVKLERVKEIEAEIKHDLMAIVKAMTEQCGDSGKYIHLGATSYDIVDTSWALIFKEALALILDDLKKFAVEWEE